MDKDKIKLLLISTFNIQNLANYLNNNESTPAVSSKVTTFGQVIPTLLDSQINKDDFDGAVVWTQPELLIESFNKQLSNEKISIDDVLNEVNAFADAVISFSKKVHYIFIPTWTLPPYHRGYGLLDFRNGIGISNTLSRMNLGLADKFEQLNKIYLMDSNRILINAGIDAQNPKLCYMGKIPYSNDVFKIAKDEIKSAINAIRGNSKKLIILDLDDTLWGGIVGDVGWENLQLGGHDHIGEAFSDFQKALKFLTKKGILLAIVSKNEELIALNAIKNNPEMVLKLDDFVSYRINWDDKAKNITEILHELNLGAQSAVFLDDNPVERSRVSEALPEIFVPDLPINKLLYKSFLLNLKCFDTTSVTNEDINRTKLYLAEKQRESLKSDLGSVEDWLKSLNTKAKIDEVNKGNLQRTVQLINKTNQMNLSTRRMSETELLKWMNAGYRKMWVFIISDKFSDSGLTGIISLEIKEDTGQIIDFILSCRVMGRNIEELMVYKISEYARKTGLKQLQAKFMETAKNKPCFDFWKNRSKFEYLENENIFSFDLKNNYNKPEHITITE
jgi:FkbH-like protein